MYNLLNEKKIEVLLDDTDESPASKFKNFDLIGIPYQVIIGSKQSDNEYEFKEITGGKINLALDDLVKKIENIYIN